MVESFVELDNACNDADNISKLKDQPKTEKASQSCGFQCITASDFGGCVSSCVQKSLGISSTCASCFGSDATCTKDKCLAQCINPQSPGCLACSKQQCGAAFSACSGLPIPGAVESLAVLADACVDDADFSKLKDQGKTEKASQTCGFQCITSSDFGGCVSSCVEKSLGVSSTCATCFGTDASCTKEKCFAQCINPQSPGCLSCSKSQCGPAFTSCSGLSIPGF
jgi:hypothetical protein